LTVNKLKKEQSSAYNTNTVYVYGYAKIVEVFLCWDCKTTC